MNKKELIKGVKFHLKGFGKVDNGVIAALEAVDRKDFVSGDYKKDAYVDFPLPTGEGQTISQPSTVARMLSLLKLKKGESVLEVGTGSGWNSALIGHIVDPGKVVSTEIYRSLAKKAKKRLKDAGAKNVRVSTKDFKNLKGKFDKVTLTAGIDLGMEEEMERVAEKLLNEEGLMLVPHRAGPIIIFKKTKKGIKKSYTEEEYMFVPLL